MRALVEDGDVLTTTLFNVAELWVGVERRAQTSWGPKCAGSTDADVALVASRLGCMIRRCAPLGHIIV